VPERWTGVSVATPFCFLLARSSSLTPPEFSSNCPSYGPGTEKGLETELTGWMLGGKSPGAMGLEHESGDLTVEGFINTYAGLQQNGWDAR
jgi:hypothetical protein